MKNLNTHCVAGPHTGIYFTGTYAACRSALRDAKRFGFRDLTIQRA